jgi:hypothetical protein
MRSRRNRRSPLRTLVDVALAALAVGGAALAVDLILSFHWTPRIVPLGDGETLCYPASALWVVAGLGAALAVAGLRLGLDRQYHNWLLVGTGVGLLTLGTSFAARERVVITPDELAVRRWWGFQSYAWRYDDLESITVVSHHRRKGRRWITLRVEVRDGGRAIEEVGVPLMIDAARLTLQAHARAKGVGVGWAMDSR